MLAALLPWIAHAQPKPAPIATSVQAYGSAPLQFGELRLPAGDGPFPVAVLVHGGCWTSGYANQRSMAAMADALAREGVASWNIEYRQLGDAGGGWPGTFWDWAAALDHLRLLQLSAPLDLERVVVAGHSAGGHAALWLAARRWLPAGSELRSGTGAAGPLPVQAVVNLDGPAALAPWVGPDAEVCEKPVLKALMGGTPAEQPLRWQQAAPELALPLRVPQYLITGPVLTEPLAQAYAQAAQARGDTVQWRTPVQPAGRPPAGHFEVLDPAHPAGQLALRTIVDEALAPAFASQSLNYRCARGQKLSVAQLTQRGGAAFASLQWAGKQVLLQASPAGQALRFQSMPISSYTGLVWQLGPDGGQLTELRPGGKDRSLSFDCVPVKAGP